jgi:parallel beta-helix repeat protein
MRIPFLATPFLLATLCVAPRAAHAAQSYDNCAHFIDTLPATISSQGTYCLRKDLSTTMTNGAAITINTNDVTIDCNDFKLGGLAAGKSSTTDGIFVGDRQDATIRNCNIRGFHTGISINGGSGHLVEDNRLDNNLMTGIYVAGDRNLVRGNRVYDTGGFVGGTLSTGIYGSADIVDNVVEGVSTAAGTAEVHGIWATGDGLEVRGNQVAGLAFTGSGGLAYAIMANGNNKSIMQNRVSAGNAAAIAAGRGIGIKGFGNTNSFCVGNRIADYATPIDSCQTPVPDDNAIL